MKPCKYCKQDIKDNAKRCQHCGSYQLGLRVGMFINLGIPFISILIAIISMTQTYVANTDKKQAVQEMIVANTEKDIAFKEKNNAEHKTEEAVQEKNMVIDENRSLQNKVITYEESLRKIDTDVNSLRNLNTTSNEFNRRLNKINQTITDTKKLSN